MLELNEPPENPYLDSNPLPCTLIYLVQGHDTVFQNRYALDRLYTCIG